MQVVPVPHKNSQSRYIARPRRGNTAGMSGFGPFQPSRRWPPPTTPRPVTGHHLFAPLTLVLSTFKGHLLPILQNIKQERGRNTCGAPQHFVLYWARRRRAASILPRHCLPRQRTQHPQREKGVTTVRCLSRSRACRQMRMQPTGPIQLSGLLDCG